jgi:hypothetical protein
MDLRINLARLYFYPLSPRENCCCRRVQPIINEFALFAVPGRRQEASLGPVRSAQALRFGPLPARVLFLSQLSVDIGQELMGIG